MAAIIQLPVVERPAVGLARRLDAFRYQQSGLTTGDTWVSAFSQMQRPALAVDQFFGRFDRLQHAAGEPVDERHQKVTRNPWRDRRFLRSRICVAGSASSMAAHARRAAACCAFRSSGSVR